MKKTNRFIQIFLCLFVLLIGGVNSAWATDWYWKGTAVAVGDGKVAVQGWKGGSDAAPALDAITEEQWKTESAAGTFTSNALTRYSSGYGRIGYYAKADEGKYFWGWYTSSECTEDTYVSDSNPRTDGKKAANVSTNSASPTDFGTYYAKFSDDPIFNYSITISASTDAYNPAPASRHGGVFTLNSIGNEGETVSSTSVTSCFAYGKYCNVGAYQSNTGKTAVRSSRSTEASKTERLYTTAISRHGYKFTGWNITDASGQTVVADGYSSDYWRCAFDITATSASPTKTGTVSANFAESTTAYTITVNKDAGLGTVEVQQAGFYPVASNNKGFNELRAVLGTMGIDDESTSYTNDTLFAGDCVVLYATPEGDNAFFGWYKVEGSRRTFITDQRILYEYISGDATYYALFQRPKVFAVGNVNCDTWEQAVATAVNGSEKIILLKRDYTLPAGNYTLPAGVTLFIPFDVDHSEPWHTLRRIESEDIPTGAYRTLTLANGAHIDVYGTIEVSGTQTHGTTSTRGDIGIGRPGAPTYGQMTLEAGSSITLNDGAIFKGYGYVLGQGEIDARRGSKVHEQFQLMDYLGFSKTMAMTDRDEKTLPLCQYYIQNIEAPVKYHPGAKLAGYSSLQAGTYGYVFIDDVGIMGVYYGKNDPRNEPAMFLMDDEDDSEDTWVRKYYDVEHDQQVYEVNNAAYLGSLVMNMMGGLVKVDSRVYILPLPNNFKLHLLSGHMHITQDTELLPGTEIEVNKKSTLIVDEGATLYLYDANDWGNFVLGKNGEEEAFVYATTVKWRPGGKPNVRTLTAEGLGSAKLKVHGTVEVKGYLKTTDGGAAITSSIEDAGSVVFATASPAESENDKLWQIDNLTPHYVSIHCVPALLKNAEGSSYGTFSRTQSTAAGKSFNFIDFNEDGIGEWVCLTAEYDHERDCYPYVYDQGGVYYIKPQAYVPISSGDPVLEADNTVRDHYAGTDRIFIMTDDCQWWEVEETTTPGVFHCTNPKNDTYYVYDASPSVEAWVEKKFKVSWVNWDGSPVNYWPKNGRSGHPEDSLNYYMVTYGTVPQWLGENPSHADDASHNYSFKGWMPTPAAVTADVTYTAQYEEKDRMYAIRFYDKEENGGSLIELVYCKLGQTPACSNHELAEDEEWSPALGTVAGNQNYTLVSRNTVGPFDIKFVNWNGTQIGETQSVVKNATPTPPAEDPEKADDDLHSYTFAGWSPAVGPATGHTTYTATYTTGPRSYTIRFLGEGGSPVLSSASVAYGTTPTPPTGEGTTKAATDAKTYTLVWSPLVGSVVGNQDYTATFTEQTRQYTVTWKNYDGSTITTDYVDYGATPAYSGLTPEKEDADKIYTFTGWSPAIVAVSGNQEYTAQFDAGHLKTVEVALNATNSMSGHVETLILNASETASGQLTGDITATDAYYDLKFTDGSRRHWHAFGVPWQVNLDTDPITEVETGRTFMLGRDYDILYYNGAKRAAGGAGANCWEYVEHHSHILQPGQGYMIAFTSDIQTLRFAKKAYAPVIFSGTMTVPANNGGAATDNGINAIANPMAYHASLTVAGVGQVHDGGEIGHDGYDPYDLADPFVVGKAVYVQVTSGQTLTPSSGISPAAAPARREARATDKEYLSLSDFYAVALTNTNNQKATVYVLPEEDKENEYVIGHDLLKMGMSDRKPQIWVNRYNVKLCLNTAAPTDGVVEYPISVYAPAAGDYTINSVQPAEISDDNDYVVYLTQNGEAIWNLSDASYALSLSAGVNKTYGLRLSARKVPTVVTGVDEAIVDAQGETRKVLINNQVFIIRGNNVYSVDGQMVK